jgi:osmotically-inducible protein OsmY
MADRRYGNRQGRGEDGGRELDRRDEDRDMERQDARDDDRGRRPVEYGEETGPYDRDYRERSRYGRGYEYGGDEDRGRFDRDRPEEYHRGGLMRGAPGVRRMGGPGEEMGESAWAGMRPENSRGEWDRYGAEDSPRRPEGDMGGHSGRERGRPAYARRGRDDRDMDTRPPHGRLSNMERPITGYSTSPTRDMDREMGHGAARGGMQGAYRVPERSMDRPQGRGPRNYQRSDERIREDICDRLSQAWMDAGDVDVTVSQGEVTLTGQVRSREEKRAIEDLIEGVLGVKDVHNQLRLMREQPSEERSSQRGEDDQPHMGG